MSKKYIFRLFFESIDFEKQTPNNQSYSFSLMAGFKVIGSITNVSIDPCSRHQQISNLPSLAFEYDYIQQAQEDITLQLSINDETQYNQQKDIHHISVLELVYYFKKNKQENKINQEWIIYGEMNIRYHITKQEKSLQQNENQSPVKQRKSSKSHLGMIGLLFESLEKQRRQPVKINRNAVGGKTIQNEKSQSMLTNSMSRLGHHRTDMLRTSRMEQPLPKHSEIENHGHHHGHSEKLSIRMKIVIIMLIFGFLFLCVQTVKFNMKFNEKKKTKKIKVKKV